MFKIQSRDQPPILTLLLCIYNAFPTHLLSTLMQYKQHNLADKCIPCVEKPA